MQLHVVSLAAALAFGCAAFPAHAQHHNHAAAHGGILVETPQAGLEIVARPDAIRIYVDDHGKAVRLDGARARVTLLHGSEKSEVVLVPAGDRLEAQGRFRVGKGTKGVVVLTLAGKPPVTARFVVP